MIKCTHHSLHIVRLFINHRHMTQPCIFLKIPSKKTDITSKAARPVEFEDEACADCLIVSDALHFTFTVDVHGAVQCNNMAVLLVFFATR